MVIFPSLGIRFEQFFSFEIAYFSERNSDLQVDSGDSARKYSEMDQSLAALFFLFSKICKKERKILPLLWPKKVVLIPIVEGFRYENTITQEIAENLHFH